MKIPGAFERQRQIFIDGIAGKRPTVPLQEEPLRLKAKSRMSAEAYAYIAGAASEEQTMHGNRAAFDALHILPRMMRDNSAFDFSSELLGTRLPFPFLLAPIGALDMVSAHADEKVAAACETTGIPYIFSNQGGSPMEACARLMPNTGKWFQLYWSKSDELILSLVKRAEQCGCSAIVLTVDTTLLGWRPRDLQLGYLPFLKAYGIAQYTSDPVFQKYVKEGWSGAEEVELKPKLTLKTLQHLLTLKRNYKGPLKEAIQSVRLFTQIYTNPALNWEKLKWLTTQTQLPILVKGILHPEDARLAQEAGAAGVIVSNHGGRQVDGALSTIEALPAIRKSVPASFKVLLDSGIRSGSDIFKAIALGADAVLLGRPYTYGLAIAGEVGVENVIRNFQNDFELTSRLAGCKNLEEIRRAEVK